MEPRYRREELAKPPLVEALFEVRVDSAVPYALVPGHLHSALGSEFENVREVVPAIIMDIVPPPPVVFHRFESQDKKRLIQCGPSVLTANVLDDYGAFESFESHIGFAMENCRSADRNPICKGRRWRVRRWRVRGCAASER